MPWNTGVRRRLIILKKTIFGDDETPVRTEYVSYEPDYPDLPMNHPMAKYRSPDSKGYIAVDSEPVEDRKAPKKSPKIVEVNNRVEDKIDLIKDVVQLQHIEMRAFMEGVQNTMKMNVDAIKQLVDVVEEMIDVSKKPMMTSSTHCEKDVNIAALLGDLGRGVNNYKTAIKEAQEMVGVKSHVQEVAKDENVEKATSFNSQSEGSFGDGTVSSRSWNGSDKTGTALEDSNCSDRTSVTDTGSTVSTGTVKENISL